MRAVRRSGVHLSVGQNFLATINKNYGVPIHLRVAHRWIFGRPGSLRPHIDRADVNGMTTHNADSARSAGLERKGISPDRMRVAVPPSFAKLIGLGDVSVSRRHSAQWLPCAGDERHGLASDLPR